MKKLSLASLRYAAPVAMFALAFLCPSITHAAGTLTATQTVANVLGINDQTDAISTTTANVVGVQATRTLTVNSLPVASTTTKIGSCTVTYSSTVTASSTCAANTAIINITTSNTAALVAAALRSLTNVVDNVNGHGALTLGGSGVTASFTSSSTEASSTPINFVDGTTGVVSSSASTSGTVPVAEILAITFGGTVDPGDLFNIGLPGPITASYTTQSTDSTLANLATGMYNDILTTAGYSSQSFTVATSSNAILFTAKTAGTPFYLTSLTVNATPTAQVVTFAPSGTNGSEDYTIVLNGTTYTYDDGSGLVSNILGGIIYTIEGNSTANCVENGSLVTCTAKTAGTPFTFSVSTFSGTSGSGGTSGGGGGGGGGEYYVPVTTHPKTTATNTTTNTTTNSSTTSSGPVSYPTGSASLITKTLRYGAENNSVKILQTLLSADSDLGFTSKVTGYFGLKTEAAVEAFQVKYNVVAPGAAGYGSVGPKTRAMLVTVFG